MAALPAFAAADPAAPRLRLASGDSEPKKVLLATRGLTSPSSHHGPAMGIWCRLACMSSNLPPLPLQPLLLVQGSL